jgi:ABC-type maltose transport system permease subunit
MLHIVLLIEIILFALVFYRLVTTNHWTIGKKLLVGLTAGVITEAAGFIAAMLLNLDPVTLIFVKIPKMIVSGVMVYFFYRNEVEH